MGTEIKTFKEFDDRWLGNKKIKLAQKSGQTSGGVELIKIVFDDDSTTEYSMKMLESEGVVTNKPQDLTAFRDKRVVGPVREMLGILRDFNLTEKELPYAIQKLEASLVENIRGAQRILWGIQEDGEQTLSAVDRILLGKKVTLQEALDKSS